MSRIVYHRQYIFILIILSISSVAFPAWWCYSLQTYHIFQDTKQVSNGRIKINALAYMSDATAYAKQKGDRSRFSTVFCNSIYFNLLMNIDIHYIGWENTADITKEDNTTNIKDSEKFAPTFGKVSAFNKYLQRLCHLDNSIYDNDTIMILTDGSDIIYQRNLSVIQQRFMSFDNDTRDTKIVCAAETNCYPYHGVRDRGWCELYPSLWPNNMKDDTAYPNGGACIGKLSSMCNAYDIIVKLYKSPDLMSDDQFLLHYMLLHNETSHLLTLDWNSEIFQTVHDRYRQLQWKGVEKGWYNKVTQTYPAIFHFNGNGRKYENPQKMIGALYHKLVPNDTIINPDLSMILDTDVGKIQYGQFCNLSALNMTLYHAQIYLDEDYMTSLKHLPYRT